MDYILSKIRVLPQRKTYFPVFLDRHKKPSLYTLVDKIKAPSRLKDVKHILST